MQFDDAICRHAVCGYALGMQKTKAVSESYKCMVHSPAVGSSIDFFLFAVKALFLTLLRLVAS